MRATIVLAAMIAAAPDLASTSSALGQVTARESVDSSGAQANGPSAWPPAPVSAEGRFVAFMSEATNLVPGDTNGVLDVFVHDRVTGQTVRVSVDSNGNQSDGFSGLNAMTPDGRYVHFNSVATNLVASDSNGKQDVFLHDNTTGATELVSVNSAGAQGDSNSYMGDLTPDGRYAVFVSNATNLVPDDHNGHEDVFVRDRSTGETTRVSVSSDGTEANSGSRYPRISRDARFVAFESFASNLVPGDTNEATDVFVHDRATQQTIRVSVDSHGGQADGFSYGPALSADGRLVFFTSAAPLVPEDSNGRPDAYLHDCNTGETSRISVSSSGDQGNSDSFLSTATPDGRFVGFDSYSDNLVPGDTNKSPDAFLRDRQTGETERISISTAGTEADFGASFGGVDSTGANCTLVSAATNLVPFDTNNVSDVFVHARVALAVNGTPRAGNPMSFTLTNANSRQVGNLAVVLLSCSGTSGFELPNGRTLHLDWDACTRVGLGVIPLLSATIDANGQATTPTFTFPEVVPGITIYVAAITFDLADNKIVSVTLPVWFETL
ncbi:MAG: calcium-binding protein [Planctomycetota bacterium]